jgi:hypothetical protein
MLTEMAGLGSGRVFSYLALSIAAVAALVVVSRSTCSDGRRPADTSTTAGGPVSEESASIRVSGDPGTPTFAGESGEGDRSGATPDTRMHRADPYHRSGRWWKDDEQYRAWQRWRAEYDTENDALRRLQSVPRRDRDQKAIQRAISRVVALQEREPHVEEVGISESQRQQLDELPKARHRWQMQHRQELDALRSEREAARSAGDSAGVLSAEEKIRELRATQPSRDKILSE